MFIDAGQTRIYADIRGEGEPIIILHGLSFDSASMAAWMEPLFEGQRVGGECVGDTSNGSAGDSADHRMLWQKQYKRIYLDLPGMGRSPVGGWIDSSDRMLDAICEAVERIVPGASVLLCGYSYGSYIVQGLVHRLGNERVRGIALLGPLVKPYERDVPKRTVLEREHGLYDQLSADERQAFDSQIVLQTELVRQRLNAELMPGAMLADTTFLQSEFRTKRYAFTFDVAQLEEPCEAPALIVCGRQDHVAGYRNALALLEPYPRAAYHILDRCGHLLMLEQREALICLVAEWLRRTEL